jgi:hypothetical protein
MDIAKYPEMDMDKVERGDSGQINIYCIVHRENNRVYIGQTRDLKKRIGEHQRRPPRRMKGDWDAAKGKGKVWKDVFAVKVLDRVGEQKQADTLERRFTFCYKSTGKNGYNMVRGQPFTCNTFWRYKKDKGKPKK